ncbi:sensor histidine kinase [Pseudoxanthomonas mexicana]|uniref:sensor histidine kinase n=1 Tax=Pseudoxanthomonas mexicana TaxID=128785 RepID=UPI0022F3CF44|nr:HAMP domain-containing sensor histidine kinase [Pseudoxanthomonas mexicana]WBX93717.1 HAMP domain-containing sensor histidine kinase [Pseudoxanthomonas mexicana]
MRLRIPSQGDDITDHTTQKEQQDVLMRLPDFIQANMQRILDDAVDFAITQAPEGAQLNHKRLRNDIPLILRDIVADLRTPQSAAEQRDKAQGRTPHATSPESAASSHGCSRADDGFGVNQMIAEYRALRASVLRLWAADQALSGDAIDDMMRFNEAIDQAVAESLLEFSRTVESWRNVFLGALGHDLRGPLAAVVGTAELLADTAQGTPHAHQAARILSGGQHLSRLVDGLLDYSKSTLGAGMPLHRIACDLGEAVAAELDLLQAALPEAPLRLQVQGATHGYFDDARIREAVHNLVTNAAKYGQRAAPIEVTLTGDTRSVRIAVSNTGQPLSSDMLHALFDPLRRGSLPAHKGEHASLGLGLFLVREIAIAHGGDVAAHVGEGVTTFVIHLPRGDSPAA